MRTLYLCLSNKGNPESLDCHKVYQGLPDKKAEALDMIRIIDESGEDYLYPKKHFYKIKLPEFVERVIRLQMRKSLRETTA